MQTLIVVQARMASTRLPGKVMLQVLGVSLLEHLIKRLRRVRLADGICVACTKNQIDQPIVDLSQKLGVSVYRGSEQDVLARYFEAASTHQAEHVIRVTSDCPLIDPKELDRLLSFYLSHTEKFDYVSSGMIRSYPRGMEAEVFSFSVLKNAHEEARQRFEREHVTPFIYTHPETFRLENFAFGQDQSHYRLTVDTADDFELVSKIITALYPSNPEFTIHDVLALLSEHSDWATINSHVRQKHYTE